MGGRAGEDPLVRARMSRGTGRMKAAKGTPGAGLAGAAKKDRREDFRCTQRRVRKEV